MCIKVKYDKKNMFDWVRKKSVGQYIKVGSLQQDTLHFIRALKIYLKCVSFRDNTQDTLEITTSQK
jgi:hypothetical protein